MLGYSQFVEFGLLVLLGIVAVSFYLAYKNFKEDVYTMFGGVMIMIAIFVIIVGIICSIVHATNLLHQREITYEMEHAREYDAWSDYQKLKLEVRQLRDFKARIRDLVVE